MENKYIFYFRFLNEFLDEFNRVLSIKLLNADQSETENQAKLDEFSSELEKIETTRREVNTIYCLNIFCSSVKIISFLN